MTELEQAVVNWYEARKHFATVEPVHGPDPKKDGGGWIPKEAWDRLADAEAKLSALGHNLLGD